MYTTCIYCHRDLGRNEALEEFPVGRRLAFDGRQGRLWAVCRHCERWNLSPLDTRWEAIEAAERAFHDTRMRVSSENIGLAKLREGLELVRVGEPLRHEFAAWRYGDQFGRRRKRAIAYTTAGVATAGAVMIGGAAAGISVGAFFPGVSHAIRNWWDTRTVHRLRDPQGHPIQIQRYHLRSSRLVPALDDAGWALRADYVPGWSKAGKKDADRRTLIVTGDEALSLASRLMAHANRRGGKKSDIANAVERIEAAGHPEAFLPTAARESQRLLETTRDQKSLSERQRRRRRLVDPGSLAGLDTDLRLAVEMATQEQAEREALEGELKGLEAMWREAEEIAHIADNLLVPESVDRFIAEERERGGGARSDGGLPT